MKFERIPYGRQHITPEDIDAVINVLKSEFLTQGPAIRDFENAFAQYVGSKYAVAVANGTAALHLAVIALDLKPGEKVITTPITFAASANCVLYCGGEIVFSDIHPETYLLDFQKVRTLLEKSPKGTYRGIIPVDFAGRPNNLEDYRELADEFGLWLIEDACHAPGGYFLDSKNKKQFCGNGNFAELSIFSFHPVKHISAGEGGMITTNDEGLYKRLLNLRTHGIQQDPSLRQEYHGPWYYEMQELGYNYRLTDIQAALGLSQLSRASQGLKRRREIALKYFDAFKNAPFVIGQSGIVEGHAYHLYVVEFEKRNELFQFLRDRDIIVQVHYIPLHLMVYYKQFGWQKDDFPVSENYYSKAFSLPMFPTLTDAEQTYVIELICSFYS